MSNSNLILEAKLLIQRGATKEDAYLQVLKDTQKRVDELEAQVEKCKAIMGPVLTHDDFVKVFFTKS